MAERLTTEQSALVQGWMSMAHGVAKTFWERSGKTLPLDEMISVAYQGLIQAALRFDGDRPGNDENYDPYVGFGTYAKRRITGSILDWQRAQDHVPRRQRQTYKVLLEHGHGSGRSVEELGDLTGLATDKIRTIVYAVEASAVSLDDTWDLQGDVIEHVESSLVAQTVQEMIADAIASFPPAQQFIVYMRYYLGLDFGTIAAELGISVATVRVMHYESMLVLNSVFRNAADT